MTVKKSLLIKRALCVLLSLMFVFGCAAFDMVSYAAVLGDVDGDGNVNSSDALRVLQHSTGISTLSASQVKLADIDSDGNVNSSDALRILQYATGLVERLDPNEPTTKPTTQPTTKPTTQPTTSGSSFEGRVNADPSLRLRSGPGTSYSTLSNIPDGTVIKITEVSGGWGKTTYGGKTGWVSLDYVESTSVKPGTFTIKCYGYGHGVGMSQEGAVVFANRGWTYDKILLHYYYSDKTKIINDPNRPATVKYGGQTIDLKTYLCRTTMAEIGDYVHIEAIKAQVVAVYTYAKYYNFNVNSSTHAYKSSYNYTGTIIEKAVDAVIGKYVDYNSKPCFTCYCASMGGKNTSAASTWLGEDLPYLRGGRESPEPESVMKKVYTFTADEIKTLAKNNMGVTLTGDPSTWFTNIVHDSSISSSVGYIKSMKVGGKEIKGEFIRTKLFNYKVRSHCLEITYNK